MNILIMEVVFLEHLLLFFRGLLGYIRILWSVHGHEKKNRNVADIFRQCVNCHPNKVCFIYEDQEWTYQQVKLIFTEEGHYFIYKLHFI